MTDTLEKPRFRVPAGSSRSAEYFKGENSPFMAGYNPILREPQDDIRKAWLKAASRSIDALQNSGFIRGIVENSTGAVVGSGLTMSSRPDVQALGWSEEQGQQFAQQFEQHFRAWANNPLSCDASGKMTFGQMQQAQYQMCFATGEHAAFAPLIKRAGSSLLTKILLFPAQRISQDTNDFLGLTQGVYTDGWGLPVGYKIKTKTVLGWQDLDFKASDRNGRPIVMHFYDPAVSATRGVGWLVAGMTAHRQYDQVFNAVITKKLTQAVFAAAIKTNVAGAAAFDPLMVASDKEKSEQALDGYMAGKGEWYDGASIDLTKHGRIAHLYPGDEFQFIEAKGQGELQDKINEWLLREICQGAGVLYETGTGDFRGATYSSIRMGGAIEWLTVMRRRANVIIPFCQAVAMMVLDELIFTGRITYPGGYEMFLRERDLVGRCTWSGPARPQADEFKTARSLEVRKNIGLMTMAEGATEYGGADWDERMYQQKRENDLADVLQLPRPHAPTDILQTPDGLDAELNAPTDGTGERKDKKPKKGGGVRNENPDNQDAVLDAELDASLIGDENG